MTLTAPAQAAPSRCVAGCTIRYRVRQRKEAINLPCFRAHLRANLIAASFASAPELQKKTLSAKDSSTSLLASCTCKYHVQSLSPIASLQLRLHCTLDMQHQCTARVLMQGCHASHTDAQACISAACCLTQCMQLVRAKSYHVKCLCGFAQEASRSDPHACMVT